MLNLRYRWNCPKEGKERGTGIQDKGIEIKKWIQSHFKSLV